MVYITYYKKDDDVAINTSLEYKLEPIAFRESRIEVNFQ